MIGTTLVGAKLDGAGFRGSNLTEANLKGASLHRANLTFSTLSHANLDEANLNSADLRGSDLRDAKLRGANLCGAKLMVADLTGAILEKANLLRANLSDAILENCNLNDASLNRGYMPSAKLGGTSQLERTDLCGANLLCVDLSGANLRGAYLVRTNLNRVNFHDVNLDGADLKGANLTRVNLDEVRSLEGTVFEGNVGLTEELKHMLNARRASVVPNPHNTSSESLYDPQSELQKENSRQLGEAQGDLKYRYLDLEEARLAFQKIVNILEEERQASALIQSQELMRQDIEKISSRYLEKLITSLTVNLNVGCLKTSKINLTIYIWKFRD